MKHVWFCWIKYKMDFECICSMIRNYENTLMGLLNNLQNPSQVPTEGDQGMDPAMIPILVIICVIMYAIFSFMRTKAKPVKAE